MKTTMRMVCGFCGGRGSIHHLMIAPRWRWESYPCAYCGGRGYLEYQYDYGSYSITVGSSTNLLPTVRKEVTGEQ